MKKLLACTVAMAMAAAMMTACGDSTSDSSEKVETAAATSAAETDADEENTEESDAEGEGEETESEAEAEGDSEAETEDEPEAAPGSGFTPVADIAGQLKNYETASLKFAADTDVNAFAEMFNEDVGGLPGEEGYTGDEALCQLSVQEVGGIPMMKINEQVFSVLPNGNPKYLIPKIRFDMNKLFAGHEEDMEKIFSIKADLVAIGRNQQLYDTGTLSPVCVPWYGGAFGVNNNDTWNGNMGEFSMSSLASGEDDETAWSNQWAYTEVMCRPGIMGGDAQFSASFDKNYVTIMAWSVNSHIDFYVADLVFMDADGNVIEVPAENLPGGAEYVADDLPNLDDVNSALTYDEAGNCVYDDETLVVEPDYIDGFDMEAAKEAALAALE